MKNRYIPNLFIRITEQNYLTNFGGTSFGLKLASTRIYTVTAGEGLTYLVPCMHHMVYFEYKSLITKW